MNLKFIPFPGFLFEGIEQADLIKTLDFKEIDTLQLNEALSFIWPYSDNPNEGNKIKTVISEKLGNWIVMYWNVEMENEIRTVFDKILKVSNKKVNYFNCDSVTSDYQWIIANNGEIIRDFYSCWNIETNIGKPLTALEEDFIKSFETEKFVFGEEVSGSVFDATCDFNLRKYGSETLFKIGTIEM